MDENLQFFPTKSWNAIKFSNGFRLMDKVFPSWTGYAFIKLLGEGGGYSKGIQVKVATGGG
jgi:hypothetical protein